MGADTIENIVKENEYLRHQVDDLKQDAFIKAHNLNVEIVEVMKENESLRRLIKDTISSQEKSQKLSMAERRELEQNKREIHKLRLELVYLKHEARLHSSTSHFSSNAFFSSGGTPHSDASSQFKDSVSVITEVDALKCEVQRLEKELQYSRIIASNLRQQLLNYVTSGCASSKRWEERSARSFPQCKKNTEEKTQKSAEGLSFLSSPFAKKHILSWSNSATLSLQNAPNPKCENSSPTVLRLSVKQHSSPKHHKNPHPTRSSNIFSHRTSSTTQSPKQLGNNCIHQKQEKHDTKTSYCKMQDICATTADRTYKFSEKPTSKRTPTARTA